MNEEQVIVLVGDDGEEINFYVIEETIVTGVKYMLATDSDADEADAYILKEVKADDENVTYEFVEDDDEFDAVAKLFKELVDDDDTSLV